ncbi:hypothetical protein PCANC_21814 [Puccinia coronata f. sp. avenae]|uniref:Uncharacterized protein n=1 Tax=Puccinia coronata f. sp. avenae TaxID=200324 RepID=A0A2N5SGB9_9BASI|nr:hypothetical protein PCANC_21814 [Puccinia coronata f. sp. avenae]
MGYPQAARGPNEPAGARTRASGFLTCHPNNQLPLSLINLLEPSLPLFDGVAARSATAPTQPGKRLGRTVSLPPT